MKQHLLWSEIYILAISGKLTSSREMHELFAGLKKVSSPLLLDMFDDIAKQEGLPSALKANIDQSRTRLLKLMTEATGELRSVHVMQSNSVRTTVVAQKVELSQQTAKLTTTEVEYGKLVTESHDALQAYFLVALNDPQEEFPIEVLLYDLPSPYRETFTPKPRLNVERGLSRPYHYVQNNSSRDAVDGLQPAISVLYQLFLECGGIINAADLWSAFWTVVRPADTVLESEERRALILFERSLAELRYLGLVKQHRKKADHLAKLVWNGL